MRVYSGKVVMLVVIFLAVVVANMNTDSMERSSPSTATPEPAPFVLWKGDQGEMVGRWDDGSLVVVFIDKEGQEEMVTDNPKLPWDISYEEEDNLIMLAIECNDRDPGEDLPQCDGPAAGAGAYLSYRPGE
jgi:hypothetical protein